MAKPIKQTNYPGVYNYQGLEIEMLPYFLYEVSLYKIEPKRANILSSRFYISNKLLKVKDTEIIKHFKNFNVTRFITLLAAPESFIKENNLLLINK